jgi:hypothetical protein
VQNVAAPPAAVAHAPKRVPQQPQQQQPQQPQQQQQQQQQLQQQDNSAAAPSYEGMSKAKAEREKRKLNPAHREKERVRMFWFGL